MDTPIPDDQLLTILRNIELNTAQQSSTPQNVDEIIPLSMRVSRRQGLSQFSTVGVLDAIRPETFSFPIPAATPYLIIPETCRSLAFYRDSEQSPFAFVNAGQSASFRLPHLNYLRVDVLSSGDEGTIIMYASSRPYEMENRLRPSQHFNAIPAQPIGAGFSLVSPVISVVDAVAINWHLHFGVVDAGITALNISMYYVSENVLYNGGSFVNAIGILNSVNMAVPLLTDRQILEYPTRYFYVALTPQGAGAIMDLQLNYSYIVK